MFEGWTPDEVSEYREAMRLTDALLSRQNPVGMSISTRYRWLQRRSEANAGNPRALLKKHHNSGRPAIVTPTPEDIIKLKSAYLRSNRTREKGSKTLAARMLAKRGELSSEVAEAILFKGGNPANGPRVGKTPPRSIMDAMTVAPALFRSARSPRNAALSGLYCPGTMRMTTGDSGEFRRLLPGERQSWDDGSINLCVCVPWPWGGDKCSDKWGVKIGRFQLLAGLDDASDFVPGFTFVMRPLSSYRKSDVGAAMYRVYRDTYAPDLVMLEGGSWQSDMVLRFLDLANIRWEDAKGRPHKKLIENYWNRLWSVLSLCADGQIGRYRGEMERENALWIRCQQGHMDPREAFPTLDVAMAAMEESIRYLNAEQVTSSHYGSWVPQERHNEHMAANPRRAIDPSMAWLVAPEQHERQVLRGGMIRVKTVSPFGVSFPYHFAAEELAAFEGCSVRVHFDPWDSPIHATIALAQPHAGLKPGHIITHWAACLDNAPEIAEAAGIVSQDNRRIADVDLGGLERALKMRRAMQTAVRTECRILGLGGRRKATTEIRGSDGSLLRTEGGAGVQDGAIVTHTVPFAPAKLSNSEYRRREREETDFAELDEFERRNRIPVLSGV